MNIILKFIVSFSISLLFMVCSSSKADVPQSPSELRVGQLYKSTLLSHYRSGGYTLLESKFADGVRVYLATSNIYELSMLNQLTQGSKIRWKVNSIARNYRDAINGKSYELLYFVSFIPELPTRGRVLSWSKRAESIFIDIKPVEYTFVEGGLGFTLELAAKHQMAFELKPGLLLEWQLLNHESRSPSYYFSNHAINLQVQNLVAISN